jgi:general secretion pathway protein C
MFARLSAFVIWSLVAATAMFWALRFAARPPQAPAFVVPVERSAPARGDLARLFGAAPSLAGASPLQPAAASRYRLLGVMAPRSKSADETAAYGLALIAVDGKPAKAFVVGARLDNGLVLQSVSLRTASLGPADGARSMLLEMPALPAPATGSLPSPRAFANTTGVVRPVPPRLPSPVPPAAPILGTPQPPAMQSQPMPAIPEVPTNPNLPSPDEATSQ